MLRLGLALVGAALILHYRKANASPEKDRDEDSPDTSPEPPFPGMKTTLGDPVLDSAVTTNPLLYGREGAYSGGYNLGLVPGTTFGGTGFPSTLPGQGMDVSGSPFGITNEQQYLAATQGSQQTLAMLVGAIPDAIKQKISNVKSLADLQSRLVQQNVSLAKKAISWHKKVFHF